MVLGWRGKGSFEGDEMEARKSALLCSIRKYALAVWVKVLDGELLFSAASYVTSRRYKFCLPKKLKQPR